MGEIKTLLQFDVIRQELLGLVISKINSRRILDMPQSILVSLQVSQNPQWASLLPVALPETERPIKGDGALSLIQVAGCV
jgi:hypothetical protein